MSLNLAFDFWNNTSTLSKFIGYADFKYCHEILPEYSRDNEKPSMSGNFDI